jgi:hypothetical protein
MLTKSYELDARGRWDRRLDDFVEDLVLVCAACGAEPEGDLAAQEGRFEFSPNARPASQDEANQTEH